MSEYSIVVADAARARFFTLEAVDIPEMQSGPNLVEHEDLVNPESRPETQLWSDTRSGSNRASGGSKTHAYDDHRAQHTLEFERRFAKEIADRAKHMAQRNNTRHVVLVAHKRMLGLLRNEVDPILKTGIELHEYPKELGKLTPMDLHEHLSQVHLLPPRRQPMQMV